MSNQDLKHFAKSDFRGFAGCVSMDFCTLGATVRAFPINNRKSFPLGQILIGGWGCDLVARQHPEPGNRFRLRLRLRCVRACVRAKLRVRDVSAVAGCGLVEKPGGPSIPPSVRAFVAVAKPLPCFMLVS